MKPSVYRALIRFQVRVHPRFAAEEMVFCIVRGTLNSLRRGNEEKPEWFNRWVGTVSQHKAILRGELL
jgi:hypothetical protein